MHSPGLFKALILNNPGKRNIINGIINDITIQITVFIAKCIWVFLYTTQKPDK